MPTYEFDLDILNKLLGTHLDIVNLAGGGIGLAPGIKLILDKGTGDVCDYYDSQNSRRVMTIGGSDALRLDVNSLDLLNRLIKNPSGIGGSTGRSIVFTSHYVAKNMRFETLMGDISAGAIVVVDADIECADISTGPDYVTIIGQGGKIYTTGDYTIFRDMNYLEAFKVHFEGSNNVLETNNVMNEGGNGCTFRDCLIEKFYTAFKNHNPHHCHNLKILGCTILDWYNQAIDYMSDSTHWCYVCNNYMKTANAKSGCYIAQHVFFHNNYVECTNPGYDANYTAIYAAWGNAVIITHNTTKYSGRGISLHACSGLVQGNHIWDAWRAIMLGDDWDGIEVLDNRIYVTSGQTRPYGIVLELSPHAYPLRIDSNSSAGRGTLTNGFYSNHDTAVGKFRSFHGNDFGETTNPINFYDAAQEKELLDYDNNIGDVAYLN